MAKTERKVSWDVVRVVAVLAVVVGHITRDGPVVHPELGPFAVHLPVLFGANTLLVVSAYFICVTVRRGRTARWLGHKLARVLPPYLVAAVVTYAVLRVAAPRFGWYTPDSTDLFANVLLIQTWSPEFHFIDGSYWTMSAQVLAFAVAALLAPRRWLRGPALMALLWALIVVPVVVQLLIRRQEDGLLRLVYDGMTLHRAAVFGVGVAVWLWTQDRLSGFHLTAYSVAMLIGMEVHTRSEDTASTAAFGIALLVLAAAAGGPDWNVGPLARPITWLGGISFGVYLVHQELGYVIARLLVDMGVGQVGRFLTCLIAAVVLGWLLTRVVERPAHAWLTGGRRAQPQGPSSGGSPVSPVAGPRPVSQPSTAAAGPATVLAAEPASRNDA
ncbi:acyltransferase [Actinokineospora sp. UTMC 2448]|uniref:acyltransferase family protein n=1 Tax=Actinokineospora sp. UTMC 2448 TaxID=2268449 RepID=UPI002164C294|nr:acyltransferase [Actinokineospora sp. UTMC 2448]UVS80180.1 Acyltransferase family protein [Actinokineospora sp. UTMC 2448]